MMPIDLGGMRSTGITAIAYNRLLDHLGIEGMAKVADPRQAISSGGPSHGTVGAREGMKRRVRVVLLLIALFASWSITTTSPATCAAQRWGWWLAKGCLPHVETPCVLLCTL